MKKVVLITVVALSCSFAQARSLAKGDSIIGGSLGFGGGGYNAVGTYEQVITNNIAKGVNISAGAAGFSGSYNTYYGNDLSYVYIGAVINVNYYQADFGNFQPYGGLSTGYLSYAVTDADYSRTSGIQTGAHIGARYYFSDSVAANVRLGGYLSSVGIDIRF